jgi:hypothetical protein
MKHQRWRDVSEAVECIRGAWRWTEQTDLMELMELMELEVNTKHWRQSKQLELITDG